MYCYLIDDYVKEKKTKRAKKCIMKRRLKSEDYKKSLENKEITLRSQ